MNRRTFLAGAGIALSSGAVVYSIDRDSTAQCHLMHEIVDPDDHGDAIESYEYDELSPEAKQVFDAALADGSYATTDESLDAPAFRYWDEAAAYEIAYRNETYGLLTYSGEGCEP